MRACTHTHTRMHTCTHAHLASAKKRGSHFASKCKEKKIKVLLLYHKFILQHSFFKKMQNFCFLKERKNASYGDKKVLDITMVDY